MLLTVRYPKFEKGVSYYQAVPIRKAAAFRLLLQFASIHITSNRLAIL